MKGDLLDEYGMTIEVYESIAKGFELDPATFEEFLTLQGYIGILIAVKDLLVQDKSRGWVGITRIMEIECEIATCSSAIEAIFNNRDLVLGMEIEGRTTVLENKPEQAKGKESGAVMTSGD